MNEQDKLRAQYGLKKVNNIKGKGRYMRWILTINNPDTSEIDVPAILKHLGTTSKRGSEVEVLRLLVYQKEKGEKTGTEHFQVYVEFEKSFTRKTVSKIPGFGKCFITPCGGNKAQCVAYVTKSETRVSDPIYWPSKEAAESAGQGKRSDVAEVADMVVQGADNQQIALAYPQVYMKMPQGINALRSALLHSIRDHTDSIRVVVLLGPTRTGKSHWLAENFPPNEDNYWWEGGKWFPNYANQNVIVMDEFRGTWCTPGTFMKIVDNKPMTRENKGGFVTISSTVFLISTNVHPADWWSSSTEHPEIANWETSPIHGRIRNEDIIWMEERYKTHARPDLPTRRPTWYESSVLRPPTTLVGAGDVLIRRSEDPLLDVEHNTLATFKLESVMPRKRFKGPKKEYGCEPTLSVLSPAVVPVPDDLAHLLEIDSSDNWDDSKGKGEEQDSPGLYDSSSWERHVMEMEYGEGYGNEPYDSGEDQDHAQEEDSDSSSLEL